MSRYLVDQIERDAGVEVLRNTEVRELVGTVGALKAVVVEDNRTQGAPPDRGARLHSHWG